MHGAQAHAAQPHQRLLIDLFCQVIDNYGDIGVCWRLARHLTEKTSHHVRLWVDNLDAFQNLAPQVEKSDSQSLSSQITVLHWAKAEETTQAGDLVIEAFGCTLPHTYLAKMLQKNSLWVNLEYLSAEDWVHDCHGLPSLQANGLRKYFFFPGFTTKTGGLLREPGLLEQRDRWLETPQLRWDQLKQLGVTPDLLTILENGGRQIFFFNYPDAPVDPLVRALQADSRPAVILQPHGSGPGNMITAPNVYHVNIPFVPQIHFDTLLWGSDLNLVRGEDSFVRAIWAGKPFIWHIYPQTGDTHITKLSAWLGKSPFNPHIKQLQTAWNSGQTNTCEEILRNLLEHENDWRAWQTTCCQWSQELAQQTDLASNLLRFFTEHIGTR